MRLPGARPRRSTPVLRPVGRHFTDGWVSRLRPHRRPKLMHVGCWADARRKFADAVKVNRDDAAAIQMVMRMDALFVVDRDARKRKMTVPQRLASRREHAEIWAEEIRQECLKLATAVLPKSA